MHPPRPALKVAEKILIWSTERSPTGLCQGSPSASCAAGGGNRVTHRSPAEGFEHAPPTEVAGRKPGLLAHFCWVSVDAVSFPVAPHSAAERSRRWTLILKCWIRWPPRFACWRRGRPVAVDAIRMIAYIRGLPDQQLLAVLADLPWARLDALLDAISLTDRRSAGGAAGR